MHNSVHHQVGELICEDDYVLAGGRCYGYNSEAVSWFTAKENCEAAHGGLAEIADQAEQDIVAGKYSLKTCDFRYTMVKI